MINQERTMRRRPKGGKPKNTRNDEIVGQRISSEITRNRNIEDEQWVTMLRRMRPGVAIFELKKFMSRYIRRRKRTQPGFDITERMAWRRLIRCGFKCELSGQYFSIIPGRATDGGNMMKLSIDKKNPNLDTYVNNFQIVLWFHNRAKGKMTNEEYLAYLRRVKLNLG